MMLACPKCARFFHPKENGVHVEERRPINHGVGERTWVGHQLWQADLYRCEGCGAEVVAGFGAGPIVTYYDGNYREAVKDAAPTITVDDTQSPYDRHREAILRGEQVPLVDPIEDSDPRRI